MTQQRPFIHVVAAGQWGSGKSTFFSGFPKKMLVMQTDPYGKEQPYLEQGIVDPNTYQGKFGQFVTRVLDPLDPSDLLCQIEFFHDPNPRKPQAWHQFRDRFDTVYEEVNAGKWTTVVIDGITFLNIYTRKSYQYSGRGKEAERMYALTTEDLEELVMCRAGSLRCNVCIAAHLSKKYEETAGQFVHNPDAPGRMMSSFGAGFTEVYVTRGEKKDGKMHYWLQTRTDSKYAAMSAKLKAPDPCEPHYDALWSEWDKKHSNDGGTTADNTGGKAAKEDN